MHSGLLNSNSKQSLGFAEVEKCAEEIKQHNPVQQKLADIAIVFDYKSDWAWKIQPHAADFEYLI